MTKPGVHILAAFFSIAVFAPILWMVMDRAPPYERLFGEIEPAAPVAGSFVSIDWKIKVNKSCPPAERRSVTRSITLKSGRIIDYAPVEGSFGSEGSDETRTSIKRSFQLPEIGPKEAGPARYHSSACYACNPIQKFWPVCVDSPDLVFEIEPSGNFQGPTDLTGPTGLTGPIGDTGPIGPQGIKGEDKR